MHSRHRWLWRPLVTIIAVAASFNACGTSDLTSAPGGTLSGTIRYDGTAAAPGRPLAIAVYRTFPPKGPPVANLLLERYELPYRYEFSSLAPGTYYAGALIDVDRMDTRYAGMLNPARDPYGYAQNGAPFDIAADHGAAGADITLEEDAQ